MYHHIVASIIVSSVLLASSAAAEGTAADHADRARVAFDLQNWEEAERAYRAAYTADQKPAYLWALAQTQRLAEKCSAAIRSYQAFKRAEVTASQANTAEMMILKCEAEIAKAEIKAAKAASLPPASTPRSTDTAPTASSDDAPNTTNAAGDGENGDGIHYGWFVGGSALTAVLAGVTIWSGLDTLSARDDYEAAPTKQGFEDGVSLERRTNGLIGASAGVAAITVVLAIFTDWSSADEEPDDVAWSVSPNLNGDLYGLSFELEL